MAIRTILHLQGEEAILCEIETMPKSTDNFIVVFNPRRKDGKAIPTIDDDVSSVVYPWTRISFVEFFEETAQRENVVGLFREADSRRSR